jgi:hypothetical protein
MSKHTPGPWDVYISKTQPYRRCIKSSNGDVLAEVYGNAGENLSNATLMAEAPNLIKALEALIDVQNGPPLEKYRKEWENAMRDAAEAIKEARGEL